MTNVERSFELYKKVEELISTENNSKCIYHYTDFKGLNGIINNNDKKLHFWFTRSDCLNDSSEGYHVLDIFIEVVNELYEKSKIDNKLKNILKEIKVSDQKSFFINSKDLNGNSVEEFLAKLSINFKVN